ncbi:reverse transcriptase domain-containing protein [Tanacetum coccineum]
MNRSKWMYNIRRSDPSYLKGVQDFLTFAANNRVNSGDAGIYYPCIKYKNFVRLKNIKYIEYHLITRGFVQKYTCWSRHGELLVDNSTSVRTSMDNENGDSCINDDCENSNEMSDNVEDTTGDNDQENIQTLLEKSQKPLYASCTKFSVLSGVLRLFGVKAKHRWTDTSFTNLLEAVHEMLPDGPKQPGNDIDVYLAPLIDDLKTLWDKGVKVYDAYKKETFTL